LIHAKYRPRSASKLYFELAGLVHCDACGGRMTHYSTGDGYRYYVCLRQRKHGKAACPGGAAVRAERLEEEVRGYVDEMLATPDRVTGYVDEAIANEGATQHDPDATMRAWADRIEEITRKRERLIDLAADGTIKKTDLSARLTRLEDEQVTADRELARVKTGRQRVEDLKANRRFILESYGQALKPGLYWFPPRIRREIYDTMRISVTVSKEGVRVRGNVNANVVRYSRRVELYVQRLEEINRRLKDYPITDDINEQFERIEQELRKAREEFSRYDTDEVMAEVAT
jgi:hypothetical protein